MKLKFVITTMIDGKKKYIIHEGNIEASGKNIVSFNSDIALAHEMDDKDLAETYCIKIQNHHNRIFKIENN